MRSDAMTPIERAKRFWKAHGRTTDSLTVLHAFCNNPTTTWTPEGICVWYGVRVDRARAIVAELARCGIVEPVSGSARGHRWNAAHDWAVPRSPVARNDLRDRWIEKASAG